MEQNIIHVGHAIDVLKKLPENSIDCVMTSPPYWNQRDYQETNQIGTEEDSKDFINNLCDIFDEVKRVLKKEGTLFIVIGDTYGKDKSLTMIPERFALEMRERGWILRNEIIWNKINPKPSSVIDRFTVSHEKIYFFTQSKKYYFNQVKVPSQEKKDVAITSNYDKKSDSYKKVIIKPKREKNYRTVWRQRISSGNIKHCATYSSGLIQAPIMAGCPEDGIVLDPFIGSGTTAVAALQLGRKYIGIELNKQYMKQAELRIKQIKDYYNIK